MAETKVKRYKGDRALDRGIRKMARHGWEVETRTTRKAWFSWLTGFFTRKQVHTVTFRRTAAQ